jgi:hypothetical protein
MTYPICDGLVEAPCFCSFTVKLRYSRRVSISSPSPSAVSNLKKVSNSEEKTFRGAHPVELTWHP